MKITYEADSDIYLHIRKNIDKSQFDKISDEWVRDHSYRAEEFTLYVKENYPEVFQQFIGYITTKVLAQ